ncbi:hypothetical protein N6H14_00330 [Paenibacillus sp. CC-CFT747]|nr:hypothetical protein N6H14_00330 [Paenibacillus sp. CC-CFT747]
MSVSAKTQHPKEAAMFISFMVNDPEATAILGSERGVSGSSKVRDAQKAKATPEDKKVFDYVDLVSGNSRVNDREIPNGGEFQSALTNLGQQIAFSKKAFPTRPKSFTTRLSKSSTSKKFGGRLGWSSFGSFLS